MPLQKPYPYLNLPDRLLLRNGKFMRHSLLSLTATKVLRLVLDQSMLYDGKITAILKVVFLPQAILQMLLWLHQQTLNQYDVLYLICDSKLILFLQLLKRRGEIMKRHKLPEILCIAGVTPVYEVTTCTNNKATGYGFVLVGQEIMVGKSMYAGTETIFSRSNLMVIQCYLYIQKLWEREQSML